MILARVILDSVSREGSRLTTLELRYPRFIHSEFMTHRVFSRNSASSRAIPVSKILEQVRCNPAMPVYWGINKPGMQASEELGGEDRSEAEDEWKAIGRYVADQVESLFAKYHLHKQVLNRLLEPWQEMQTVVSSTEWDNFFTLRLHPDAQPEMRELAQAMYTAIENSKPRLCSFWHMPYVLPWEQDTLSLNDAIKVSVARCARVSYLKHGTDSLSPLEADISLFNRLAEAKHMSPFEHVAMPLAGRYGNFFGWKQYRKMLEESRDAQTD